MAGAVGAASPPRLLARPRQPKAGWPRSSSSTISHNWGLRVTHKRSRISSRPYEGRTLVNVFEPQAPMAVVLFGIHAWMPRSPLFRRGSGSLETGAKRSKKSSWRMSKTPRLPSADLSPEDRLRPDGLEVPADATLVRIHRFASVRRPVASAASGPRPTRSTVCGERNRTTSRSRRVQPGGSTNGTETSPLLPQTHYRTPV